MMTSQQRQVGARAARDEPHAHTRCRDINAKYVADVAAAIGRIKEYSAHVDLLDPSPSRP